MDFDEDEFSNTNSRGSSSLYSSKSKRRRLEPPSSQSSSREREDSSSVLSSTTSSLAASSAAKVSVRGAGTSAWAVQDAGTYRMLHDECSYLCSTILMSPNPSQSVDAAIDLAIMISSRKTRSVLWQGDNATTQESSSISNETSSSSSPSKKRSKQTTVFHSILDVLSKAAATITATAPAKKDAPGSPARTSRTKSARRKIKQMQTASSSVTSGAATNVVVSPEMKQVLASIFYFLSWDCTMSEQNSVAVMGAVKAPAVARKLRNAILQHGEALQGAMSLISSSRQNTNNGTTASSSVASSSVAASSPIRNRRQPSSAPSSPATSSQASSSILEAVVKTDRGRILHFDSMFAIPPSPGEGSSVSSVSFQEQEQRFKPTTKRMGDPTAAGRRNRRNRRNNTVEMQPVPEDDDLDWPDAKIIPPPPKASRLAEASRNLGAVPRMNFNLEDDTTFMAPSPPRKSTVAQQTTKSTTDQSVAAPSVASDVTSFMTAKISQKLNKLLSKVTPSNGCNDPSQYTNCEHQGQIPNDNPWVTMVCLESLNRIVTGKEEGGPSCMEGEGADTEEDLHDERNNPILMTNMLLGKTGVIPMLARAMSQSLGAVCQQLMRSDCVHCWTYWHDRISILASLIDGACLFNGANRRAFCEDDPFSFVEQNDGLVFHILLLLSQFCGRRQVQDADDSKMSGIMLLALRTLTSLTHDNELAAEQMKMCNEHGDDATSSSEESSYIRGLDILAELVFELEENGKVAPKSNKKKTSRRISDEDLHRYDSTIFCLNTLANIIEAEGVRRMLAEIQVVSSSGKVLWLQWLCRWLVNQTDTFRDAILGIGKDKGSSSSSSERELQKHEEDRLVAAGNGGVLLACLMTEPEEISEEPESTNTIRNLIIEQMPRNDDGSSTGVTMIINTLKAFCNFYHFSLGELSVAIVTPVKKLIQELEELQKNEIR